MSLEMSRSEILEAAQALRQSSQDGIPCVYTPDESAVLDTADMITNERRSTGITGVIESALAAIRGERASAELALQKARQREAELETLIQQKAGVLKAIERERDALAGIEALILDYRKRTSPKAERDQMRSRFHARMDARFQEHLPHAVQGILEARLILEMLPDYAEMSRAEILKMEADLGEIDRKISKAKK